MPLEAATYVSALVATNPASTDLANQGDDHIRLIKAALKATFPNLNGPVALTPYQMLYPVPIGGIISWYGSAASVPAGWAVCRGQTVARSDGGGNIVLPDLRGLFLQGATTTGGDNFGTELGAASKTTSDAGSHSHGGAVGVSGHHTHSLTVAANGGHNHGGGETGNAGAHDHSAACSSNGGHAHGGETGLDGAHTHGGTEPHTLTEGQLPEHYHFVVTPGDGEEGETPSTARAVATDYLEADSANYLLRRSTATYGTVGRSSRVGSGSAHSHDIPQAQDHRHTISAANDHNHTINVGSVGSHSHGITAAGDHTHSASAEGAGSHNHTIEAAGQHTHTVNVIPPAMTLHFLMKV